MWYICSSESSILALVLHLHPQENYLFFCCRDVTKYTMCLLSLSLCVCVCLCVYVYVRMATCLSLHVCLSMRSLTAPANAQIVHSGAACNVKDDNISERIYTIKEGDTLVLQCIVKGHPRPQVSSQPPAEHVCTIIFVNVHVTRWWCWFCYP